MKIGNFDPQRLKQVNVVTALIVAIVIIAIGTVFLLVTKAAVSTTAAEAELGSRTGNATIVTDTTASGGKSIAFNAPTGGGGGGGGGGGTVSATTPCVGNPAPTKWNHVVVLMFENHKYPAVIGTTTSPYISSLATKCGSYASWKDANYTVTGAVDGDYHSKPNYATLASGVPPSKHGLKDDTYSTTSSVDNIFNRLNLAGKTTKSYVSGTGGSCAKSNFSGAYHDPMRYFTNLGGQSSSAGTYCNTHDVPIADFTTDLNNGNLPAFSFILPTNDQNTHNNTDQSGDAWAKNFLDPILNSAQYQSGDTAIFFLWDEDFPIPNVLLAPSINAGSHPVAPSGNPISHYGATRTWLEMLGLPPTLGDSGQAPSLLQYYNGN